MYNVFVYGSLKKGFGNHGLLARSEFLGNAETVESRFKMVSLGGFPGVYDTGGDKIKGEIYKVDHMTLRNLDRLESEGSFYGRRTHNFKLESGENIDSFIYILLDDFGYSDNPRYLNEESSENRTAVWSSARTVIYL